MGDSGSQAQVLPQLGPELAYDLGDSGEVGGQDRLRHPDAGEMSALLWAFSKY